jgi:hypothetical protein
MRGNCNNREVVVVQNREVVELDGEWIFREETSCWDLEWEVDRLLE